MSKLTHFDAKGQAHMVDVGSKEITERKAIATGVITMQPHTLELLQSGQHKKGDVLGIARIAGIMAAKKTPELIPLCHPIMLTHIYIEFDIDSGNNLVTCTATTHTAERTGVEMEALAAVNISLLTIYDMCKAVDKGMQINGISLLEKSGGRSGYWNRNQNEQ